MTVGIFREVLIFVIAAAISFLGCAERQAPLVELEKRAWYAQTGQQERRIVEELLDYYLSLEIPDTLYHQIEQDYQSLIDTTDLTIEGRFAIDRRERAPHYLIERQLDSLLTIAQVAAMTGREEVRVQALEIANERIPHAGDLKSQFYWRSELENAAGAPTKQIENTIKARIAKEKCLELQNSALRFSEAEQFAAAGLNQLQFRDNLRTRLDIYQGLLWILYRHRSKFELFKLLANHARELADSTGYQIKLVSLNYIRAEAMGVYGENREALRHYERVVDQIKEQPDLHPSDWYLKNSMLGMGESYTDLGDYERAREICTQLDSTRLDTTGLIRLHILKWQVQRSTGNYELEEKELATAMKLAEASEETYNLIVCLNNFGDLFIRLADYDRARAALKRAYSLLSPYSSEVNLRMLILSNMADIAILQQDSTGVEEIIQKARSLAEQTNSPLRDARLQHNIGKLQIRANQHEEALASFQKAAQIYRHNGFLRHDLETQVEIIDCLIGLAKNPEAKSLISEVLAQAVAINDFERVIDAKDRLATIYQQEGSLERAVEISDQLLEDIDEFSSRFDNPDRLNAFRQRVYDALKKAVLYEIALGRPEAAMRKLDYAKAYTVSDNQHGSTAHHGNGIVDRFDFSLDSMRIKMPRRGLLLDYLVTRDSLLVFALDKDGLRYGSKPLSSEQLKKSVCALRDSLLETEQSLQPFDRRAFDQSFAHAAHAGHELYRHLFEWPDSNIGIEGVETLYIVPDEFLCEIPYPALVASQSMPPEFVVLNKSVSILPSCGFLSQRRSNGASPSQQNQRVLISADRTFPDAERFLSRVKSLFPSTRELSVAGAEISKEAVLQELQYGFDVLIILGHGKANTKYPERSFVELSVYSQEARSSKTVRLYMSDLERVSWEGTELVMLVGCETASGKLYRGTGMWGIHLGLVSLGVKNVYGNLWEVEASQAIPLAQDFVSEWAKMPNAMQAHQMSQVLAIERLQNNSSFGVAHPYFWGSSLLISQEPN